MFKVVIIIVFSAFFVFSPLTSSCVSANKAEYFVSKYIVNINIENDGSAVFEEKISFVFSGSFDGILRSIDISGTGGIQEQEVYVVDKNGNLEQLKHDNSENPGTYTFEIENNLAKFMLYEPVKDDIKTFVFKYRLADVITRYIDIAEFNRRIIDQSWDIALNDIVAVITVPQGSSANNISVFAHGPLTVEYKVVDDRNVEIKVPVISPGDYVEARVLFPPELVPYSTKFKDKYALSEIMESEKKLAAEANIKREEARRLLKEQEEKKRRLESEKVLRVKKLQPVGQRITEAMFLLWFYILLTIYFRHDRKYRHNFKEKKMTEPPGNYTPAEMSMLIWGTLQPRDLIATALDMIRKKCLVINYYNVSSKSISYEENTNNFVISRNKQVPVEHLSLKAHESFLIDWFLNRIGNGESVTTNEITEYVKDKKNSYQFKSDFEKWKYLVKYEAASLNFFEKSIKRGKYLGLNTGIVYIVAGILISTLLSVFSSIILTVMGIVLLVYSVLLKERTAYGNEQCAKWLAFRKFLKEFGTFERTKIPSIAQWEQYLPYAISLGVAKDVIRQFSDVYNEQDFNDSSLTYLSGESYSCLMHFSRILNNTIRTVENIVDTPTNIASYPDSSHFGTGSDYIG